MCGRFDQFLAARDLGEIFGAKTGKVSAWQPHYNVSPSQEAPVLFGDHGKEFDFARFGMRPSWWKHRSRDFINVRAETVRDKPFFRRQLAERRCILPVTGYYEWQANGRRKTPHRFTAAEDPVLPLACLWEVDSIEGHDRLTFAIITGPANSLMKPVHDRMPVTLPLGAVNRWLDPSTDTDALLGLLQPPPAESLRGYPVSSAVSNPGNEGPDLIEPIG